MDFKPLQHLTQFQDMLNTRPEPKRFATPSGTPRKRSGTADATRGAFKKAGRGGKRRSYRILPANQRRRG